MPYFYYDWTMILVIPGLLLGLYAQFKVKSTFDSLQPGQDEKRPDGRSRRRGCCSAGAAAPT